MMSDSMSLSTMRGAQEGDVAEVAGCAPLQQTTSHTSGCFACTRHRPSMQLYQAVMSFLVDIYRHNRRRIPCWLGIEHA